MKLNLQSLTLAWAIAFSMSSTVLAQGRSPSVSLRIPGQWSNRESTDFSGDGRPRRTAGGASRGECRVKNNSSLTALIPDTPVVLTIAESPTFWFYIPYTLTSENSVEFVLKDDHNNYVYKTQFSERETSPGIVNLRLPSRITLEAERNYDWYLLIYCDPQNQDKFVYVNGSVRRVERSSLNSSSKLPSPEERLNFYVAEGLWYDAITNLAEKMSAAPQDNGTRNNWVTLLRSVGLENLASEPFALCCSLE